MRNEIQQLDKRLSSHKLGNDCSFSSIQFAKREKSSVKTYRWSAQCGDGVAIQRKYMIILREISLHDQGAATDTIKLESTDKQPHPMESSQYSNEG